MGAGPVETHRFPLSYAQERVWFHREMEPASTLYNMYLAVELIGRLDCAALEQGLQAMVDRHESLRTTFESAGGRPVQVIAEAQSVALPVLDFSELPEDERLPGALEAAHVEYERPFDLTRGPLLRPLLMRLRDDAHVFFFATHHAVFDQQSLDVFCRELTVLYRSFCAGEAPALPPPPLQYVDFAEWQRGRLESGALDAQQAYWVDQLRGVPERLELPFGRRVAHPSHRGALVERTLADGLGTRLRALGAAHGATLHMTTLAAFLTLLHRYTGERDLVLGTVVTSRSRAELEPMIGFLANTIVLRVDLSGDPTFSELLARVRRVCLDAYANQEVPFQRVVERVRANRARDQDPLFQVGFDVHAEPAAALDVPGLQNRPLRLPEVSAKVDFSLSLVEMAGRLLVELEYNTDRFDRVHMLRLFEHYQRVLDAVVEDPQARVGAVDVGGAAEAERILSIWNRTETTNAWEAWPLHRLFEGQVKETPDATAVEAGGAVTSYAALDAEANRLANHLVALGLSPEGRVGICLERSLDQVVAILAVLKAGGAYVPLDHRWPEPRLALVAEDAQLFGLITRERALPGLLTVHLGRDREQIQARGTHPPRPALLGNSLAYVIYTSGSTGTPKGVLVEHAGACNLVRAQVARTGVSGDDRVILFASITFDASVSEIFMALSTGATLVIPNERTVAASEELERFLLERAVTVATLPPTVLRLIAPPPTVRTLLSAGEPCTREIVASFAASTRFWNAYGPTEATVCATMAECLATDTCDPAVGAPLANVRVYVLDSYLHLAPVGIAGELYIGGLQVARGYWRRPGLTAERFLPDPYAERPGARMFRTGDRAAFRPDGSLELFGRLDLQVKYRGHRVELEEIEAALRAHPAVHDAAALLTGDPPERLVAYVEPRSSFGGGRTATLGPEAAELGRGLRLHLEERLPGYMVPAAVNVLMELPRGASGKVDRRQVAELPVGIAPRAGGRYQAPRTETQRQVAEIFREVLDVERVGVTDSFFDLGGHSVIATLAVSRLREALHVDLPLRTLFDSPTVEALSAHIDACRPVQPVTPQAAPRASAAERPLSFAQRRLWFLERFEDTNNYIIPLALELRGPLRVDLVERALNAIVARHEVLRSVFPERDGEPTVEVQPATPFALPVVDLSGLPAAEALERVRALITEGGRVRFDLSAGPVYRFRLFRLGEQHHVLSLALHHIAADGWSLAVLVRELGALYGSWARGRTFALPPLPIQYADHAERERHTALGAELDYWRLKLAGLPPRLDLPGDRPRPAVQRYRGSIETFSLDPALVRALGRLKQETGTTMFMTLHAAFLVMLMRWSGETDLAVGTPVAMRDRREIEPLIGCFVNTLVLRADLSGRPTFRQVLERVRTVALDAFQHQALPFELLVEALEPRRSLSHSPFFQVMFVFQSAPLDEGEWAGVRMSPLHAEHLTSKFDLTLLFDESDQGLEGAIEYDTDLFDPATIRRFIAQLVTLLGEVTRRPDARIADVALLPDDERQILVDRWSGSDAEAPADCLHQLFERAAASAPQQVALVTRDERVTYAELDRRAEAMAGKLAALGVGPDHRVGVRARRSADLVAALLGVLKAGGAYVPLDYHLPRARIEFILADTDATALIEDSSGGVLSLRALSPPRPAASAALSPRNLAYVLYTSGSTGEPKGVAIEHRSAVELVTWARERFAGVLDLVLASSSIGFDLSVFELFVPLSAGKTVLLVDDVLSAREHPAFDDVTLLNTVPSAMSALIRRGALPARLRAITLAGEPLAAELSARCHQLAPQATLYNLYGPSENTTYSTFTAEAAAEAPAVGRPIPGERVYVLDAAMSLAPIGVVGELYVGGAGVARGYHARPALTAPRFVPDPWSGVPGARLFKTGDRGRWRADGTLELFGRFDHQVKLRGFRIELQEVESVLLRHPRVAEAAVTVDGDGDDRRLVAHLVARPPQGASDDLVAVLRSHLRRELPDYMIPALFSWADAFPRNLNGKIDRRALAAPAPIRANGYTPPSTDTEALLAAIWEGVLGRPVGVEESFFDAGGHSLLAIKLVSRVSRSLGIEVPVTSVFEAPTITQLARVVDAALVEQVEALSEDQVERLLASDG